jgi:chaperonin GroES
MAKKSKTPTIRPLGMRVLVKRIEDEEQKSEGGIFLPDSAKEKPQDAEIIALGTGGKDEDGKDIEFTVKVGNKVLISKYGGTDVKINGEECLILNEMDILGIIEG